MDRLSAASEPGVRPAMPEAAHAGGAPADASPLIRENTYLRQRVAQLQDDVAAITAEAERLRQIVERLHGRPPVGAPDPLSGGQ